MSPQVTNGHSVVVNGGTGENLEYAERLNSDPERLKFAYGTQLHDVRRVLISETVIGCPMCQVGW